MDCAQYYTQQSSITHPGTNGDLFADLPTEVEELCGIVQGLIIHYQDDEYVLPKERLTEADTRAVAKMLEWIRELDKRSLREARSPEKRLIGCCRDFATLFCAMARHEGIPARVRIGFSAYFEPDFYYDHAIAEWWDAQNTCWKLVDPQMSPALIAKNGILFDVCDIPRDQFLVAGLAWEMYRDGRNDPALFGVMPDSHLKGPRFIREKLIQDLAALNKMELLLWDNWGLMRKRRLSKRDEALLDLVARLTQMGEAGFAEMQKLYENNEALRVSTSIMCLSPVGKRRRVAIE